MNLVLAQETSFIQFRYISRNGDDLCSSQGSTLGNVFYPGVHGDVEPLRSISNSVVKRISGDDIWGVAP